MLAGECCSALTSSAPFSLLLPSLPEKFTVFFPKDGPKLVHCFLFLVDAPWIVFAVGCYQKKESSREDLHLFVSFVFAQNSYSSSSDLAILGVWDLTCRCCKWGFRSDGRATFEFLGCPSGKTIAYAINCMWSPAFLFPLPLYSP